ncbi:MAG TPA: hypothetical protein VFL13_16300 [Candidatus Baltobacteraceae bacterium]|nr:hypothetical protein [Candidatus Baltobacteraceae bacterium]
MKQAVAFGNRWALIAFGALLWPLLISFFANPTVTIIVYFLALALDAVLLVVWLRAALRYSRMASHGETFSL